MEGNSNIMHWPRLRIIETGRSLKPRYFREIPEGRKLVPNP
jgi:hypothetical protein